MSIVVQKYGGSSVATPEKLREVARRVIETRDSGHSVVVVVSAMANTTDELLELSQKVSTSPERRELDMLLTAGERISMALLSMAIRELGGNAISFTGSQAGILTNDRHIDARIIEVRPVRVQDELEKGNIVIVAGYQGMSYKREITTLGRGGSDTTAVALAAALDAEWCEICSDVDGVYSADPRVVPEAQRIPKLSYEETRELAENGAKVLNAQAVEFARQNDIAIYARAAGGSLPGEDPTRDGTVVRKSPPRAHGSVTGIAAKKQIALVSCRSTALAGQAAALERWETAVLRAEFLPVNPGEESFFQAVVSLENLHRAEDLEKREWLESPGDNSAWISDCGMVSAVGSEILSEQDNLLRGCRVLEKIGAEVLAVSATSHRISWVLPEGYVDEATGELHREYLTEH